jgi:hypothetical protein
MPATSARASKSAAVPTIAASVVGARTSHARTTTASPNGRADCLLFVFFASLHQTVAPPVLAVPMATSLPIGRPWTAREMKMVQPI